MVQRYICPLVFLLIFFGCGAEEAETKADSPIKINKEEKVVDEDDKYILFYGNSLTAGYGLDEEFSFPYLIQQKIDALDKDFVVVNAGLSGETSSGGLNRIDWVLKQDVDIFVLELGGNDLLRGLNIDATEENLRNILKRVVAKNKDIQIIIAGMMAPPNMGNDYTTQFGSIFPKLAKEFNAALVPFLLEGVAGVPSLNQRDGIHPNKEGAVILAENIWKVLNSFIK